MKITFADRSFNYERLGMKNPNSKYPNFELSKFQIDRIRRRHGLSEQQARLVAELHYVETR
jgi:hypothetical protein